MTHISWIWLAINFFLPFLVTSQSEFSSRFLISRSLLWTTYYILIQPSISMVQIVKPLYFVNSSTDKLHNRNEKDYIRCKTEKVTSWVKEITFVYFSKNLCSVGFEMRKVHRACSKFILIFDVLRILIGKPIIRPFIQAIEQKVAIQSSSFQFLILCIKNFQHISSDKLVISIKMNTDCILTTIKMVRIVIIFHGSLSFGVVYIDILGSRYFVELKIFSVDFIASVTRRIISYHSVVVAIVLSKYRIERILNTKICIVFKAGRNNAHR